MEKQFAQHIYFDRPREGAPEFVKGRMSMKLPEAIEFLKTLTPSEKGYVYFDLLVSKDGAKLYFAVNEWKPEVKTTSDVNSPF
jgi:hypothetical protein